MDPWLHQIENENVTKTAHRRCEVAADCCRTCQADARAVAQQDGDLYSYGLYVVSVAEQDGDLNNNNTNNNNNNNSSGR